MNDREELTYIRDHINAHLGAAPPPGGGGGPVEPPPGGGGTPPAYSGPIDWQLGLPNEVSPTVTRRNVSADVQYAISINKTSDLNVLRLEGTFFTYCNSSIPGFRGNYTGMQMGGLHDIPINGAPNGPLVVLFTLSASVPNGDLKPHFF